MAARTSKPQRLYGWNEKGGRAIIPVYILYLLRRGLLGGSGIRLEAREGSGRGSGGGIDGSHLFVE